MLLNKKVFFFLIAVLFSAGVKAPVCHAFTILTKEQALKEVFGSDFEIVSETERLRGATLAKVKERLGGSLVYEQAGSESEKVSEQKSVEFYYAMKDGKKVGVAVIDVQPGRWGPVEFIIAMDSTPKVKRVEVMSYQEKRGRPIARRSYMRQYVGKTTKDPLEVGKDIVGISGATISSRAATFSVTKALVLVEEVLLNKKKGSEE